jgi:hypothetical protein
LTLLVGLLALVLSVPAGCRSEQRRAEQCRPEVQPTTAPGRTQPIDVMSSADAERAKAVLERQQQERAAERPPAFPERERVVDQPRVGGTRR